MTDDSARDEDVDLDRLGLPKTSKERGEWSALRMELNVAKTGHPFHHMTADGTIVDSDPTLEQVMSDVGPDDMPPIPAYDASQALPTVPVNRSHYGFSLHKKSELN